MQTNPDIHLTSDLHPVLQQMLWQAASMRMDAACLRFRLALKAGFDPSQPRAPAGSAEGGQWAKIEGHVRETIVEEPAEGSSDARERRRRAFVLRGSGSRFRIGPNPKADPKAPAHEIPTDSKVLDYDAEIDRISDEVGIDADLIRAIMYMETTHGGYRGLGPLADLFGVSGSILPMNIQVEAWGDAFGGRAMLNVPLNNIRAGAVILRGIIGNLPSSAAVAEIATLYNLLSATSVTDYGARAEAIYDARLWEK